jgi:hypothetical protein
MKLWVTGILLGIVTAPAAYTQQLDQVVQQDSAANREAAQSQGRIDRLSDDAQGLLEEYRDTTQRFETLRVYNAQLTKLVAAQETEMSSLLRQIEDVTVIEREIRPLMTAMVDALEQFVALDVPFLLEERQRRVAFLRELLGRADVSVAEQYRRVMEAYQIENDYGRAVDSYQAELSQDGQTRLVHYLKIGRVAFLYLTPDGSEAGVWDPNQHAWVDASDFRDSIRQGLKMARKQAAFDLLTLPVPAPQSAAVAGGE